VEDVVKEDPVVPVEDVVKVDPVVPVEEVVKEDPVVPVVDVVKVDPIVPVEDVVKEDPVVPVEDVVKVDPVEPVEEVVKEDPVVPVVDVVKVDPTVPVIPVEEVVKDPLEDVVKVDAKVNSAIPVEEVKLDAALPVDTHKDSENNSEIVAAEISKAVPEASNVEGSVLPIAENNVPVVPPVVGVSTPVMAQPTLFTSGDEIISSIPQTDPDSSFGIKPIDTVPHLQIPGLRPSIPARPHPEYLDFISQGIDAISNGLPSLPDANTPVVIPSPPVLSSYSPLAILKKQHQLLQSFFSGTVFRKDVNE